MTEHMGGDPACWLHQVCEACGSIIDRSELHVCPAPPARSDPDAGGAEPEPTST